MCSFGGTPKAAPVIVPDTPVAPAAPQASPQQANPAVQQTREDERKRQRQQAAANATLVTGGQGIIDTPNTGLKSAFGA